MPIPPIFLSTSPISVNDALVLRRAPVAHEIAAAGAPARRPPNMCLVGTYDVFYPVFPITPQVSRTTVREQIAIKANRK